MGDVLREPFAAWVVREARPGSGERVLVAIMNNRRDWDIAWRQGWYRIPIKRAPRQVAADYLAFSFTSAFPPDLRHRVAYYAPIRAYRLAARTALLPHETDHPRAQDLYYRIEIGALERLERPVVSERMRRITFIPTTLDRLLAAEEIRELWVERRRRGGWLEETLTPDLPPRSRGAGASDRGEGS